MSLGIDVPHNDQECLQSDPLNFGLVVLNGPEDAVDDGPELLALDVQENLEAVLGHGLDQ